MVGQVKPRPGRPPKADLPGFEYLALAAFSRPGSQQELANRISANLGDYVSQPTVRSWLLTQLPRLARPTVSLKQPGKLGLRLAYLMFRRDPAAAVALSRVLVHEPLVSRVERWAGDVNVVAEVMTLTQEQLDELVERFEPDQVEEVLTRVERSRVSLTHLGRHLAGTS